MLRHWLPVLLRYFLLLVFSALPLTIGYQEVMEQVALLSLEAPEEPNVDSTDKARGPAPPPMPGEDVQRALLNLEDPSTAPADASAADAKLRQTQREHGVGMKRVRAFVGALAVLEREGKEWKDADIVEGRYLEVLAKQQKLRSDAGEHLKKILGGANAEQVAELMAVALAHAEATKRNTTRNDLHSRLNKAIERLEDFLQNDKVLKASHTRAKTELARCRRERELIKLVDADSAHLKDAAKARRHLERYSKLLADSEHKQHWKPLREASVGYIQTLLPPQDLDEKLKYNGQAKRRADVSAMWPKLGRVELTKDGYDEVTIDYTKALLNNVVISVRYVGAKGGDTRAVIEPTEKTKAAHEFNNVRKSIKKWDAEAIARLKKCCEQYPALPPETHACVAVVLEMLNKPDSRLGDGTR